MAGWSSRAIAQISAPSPIAIRRRSRYLGSIKDEELAEIIRATDFCNTISTLETKECAPTRS
jgi:hypothetical protein